MTESHLDRLARAFGSVPIRHENGAPVYLGLATRLELAAAALAVLPPVAQERVVRVMPAKFVTDAMANVPDSLPDNFA